MSKGRTLNFILQRLDLGICLVDNLVHLLVQVCKFLCEAFGQVLLIYATL